MGDSDEDDAILEAVRTQRREDGTIEIGPDRLRELEDEIDWDGLDPIEEYVLLRLLRAES